MSERLEITNPQLSNRCVLLTTCGPVGAGMCRAHGIAHQAVRDAASLPQALESAWRLNRHSVVEVCHVITTNCRCVAAKAAFLPIVLWVTSVHYWHSLAVVLASQLDEDL